MGGASLSCCFQRLSDPLLHSPNDEMGSLVQLEDLEKDALLEEATQPAEEAHKPARPPQGGPGLCEKEVKKKPESGSLKAQSGPLPQVEEMEREETPGVGRWGRSPPQLDKNLLNRENLNNNNSKRSCPEDFEVGEAPVWCGGWGYHPWQVTSTLQEEQPLPATSAPSSCHWGSSHPQGPVGLFQGMILQAGWEFGHTGSGDLAGTAPTLWPSSPHTPHSHFGQGFQFFVFLYVKCKTYTLSPRLTFLSMQLFLVHHTPTHFLPPWAGTPQITLFHSQVLQHVPRPQ